MPICPLIEAQCRTPMEKLAAIEWARLCPPGVPMDAPITEKPLPPATFRMSKRCPGDFPDIGTVPRSDNIEQPEDNENQDDRFHVPPPISGPLKGDAAVFGLLWGGSASPARGWGCEGWALFSTSGGFEPRDSYLANSGTGVRIQLL